jgi:hypothetical protein
MPSAMKGALLNSPWKPGKVSDMDVDSALLGVGSLNNPFSGEKLSAQEQAQALATLKKEDSQITTQMKKVTSDENADEQAELKAVAGADPMASSAVAQSASSRISAKQKALQKAVRQKYQADYAKIAYGNAKIFAVLGNPQKVDSDGVAHYSDKQIAAAFKALSKNASEQQAINQAALDRKQVEFNGVTKGSASSIANGFVGNRDLLDCLMFKPVVEQLLKDNPQYCGIATGLAMHQDYVKEQNAIATAGGMVALLVASGGLGAAADGGVAAAIGVGANISAASLAIGMDVGYDASAIHDLSRTTTAVLSDRGDGAQTTVDQKTGGQAVRDQQFAAQLQVGLSALDVPLAPAATQIVRKGIENQTAAKAAIEGLSQLTDKPTIVQKTKAAMSAFIGKDENQIKTKLFNNFVEKTAGRSPAAITEREAVNKAAVVKHLLRDVDPANETEVRASSLTLKMMQEAKPDTFDWQSASFEDRKESGFAGTGVPQGSRRRRRYA